MKILQNRDFTQAPEAHAYNPGYSEGRDQKTHCSKPAWANSSQDPILKKIHHIHTHKKRAGGVAQGIGPKFKSHHRKKTTQTRFLTEY
jgi:hypothetical protein